MVLDTIIHPLSIGVFFPLKLFSDLHFQVVFQLKINFITFEILLKNKSLEAF